MKMPGPGGARLAVSAGLIAILAATNRWEGWRSGWVLVHGHDSPIYKQMALAAPHLPTSAPNQHAEEFPLVYLVGLVHHVLGINVDYVFRFVAYAVMLGIVWTLHVLLKRAGAGVTLYTVSMAVYVLNTYSLRYYLLVPGYFLDVVFVLAIAIELYALLSGRYWLALAAIVLGVLARQTAIPTSLALAWWVAFGAGWREAPARTRALRAAAIVAAPVAMYLALIALSSSFSTPGTPGIAGLTIIGDFEHLGSQLGALADHVVRVANGLFGVASLTIVALLARRRAAASGRLPFEFIGCFVVGCSIMFQALVLNTNYSGHPERLTVLSLLPFVVGAAYLWRERERAGFVLAGATAAVIVAVLTVGSLQYLYTWVGPSTAVEGGILQFIAAVIVGALMWNASDGRGLRFSVSPRLRRSP